MYRDKIIELLQIHFCLFVFYRDLKKLQLSKIRKIK